MWKKNKNDGNNDWLDYIYIKKTGWWTIYIKRLKIGTGIGNWLVDYINKNKNKNWLVDYI
ncbi:MAG: hypothetical protein Pars92KO_32860 [Parasphingorhabdus sp.]